MWVILFFLKRRLPLIELAPFLIDLFYILLDDGLIFCITFFELVEDNIEALSFSKLSLSWLRFLNLRSQIKQIEHLRRNKKYIFHHSHIKYNRTLSKTSLKYCKIKDILWLKISYQLYYLFSDSGSMKKQPKVILLGDTSSPLIT